MTTLFVPRASGGLSCIEQKAAGLQCETVNRPYLRAVEEQKKTVYFTRPDCGLWSCEHCGEQNKRMWMGRNIHACELLDAEGHQLYFVTITSHRKVRDAGYGLKVWRDARPKLFKRARRETDNFQYCWVPEQSDGEHFHIHMITTGEMSTRWWKDNAAQTGMGWRSESEPCHDLRRAGLYTAKYLNKSLATEDWPKFTRRVNTSRKWPKLLDKTQEDPLEWRICGLSDKFAAEYIAFKERGWKVQIV